MKKLLSSFLILLLTLFLVVGCTSNDNDDNGDNQPDTNQDELQDQGNLDEDQDETDTATGPSFVTDEQSIKSVMSPQGTWIVIFTKDMSTTEELVLDGSFTNKDQVVRKIALYEQDENRVKTARFTLTAPILTIKSENASVVGGTFKGDIYVEASGFSVDDGTVEGNLYFANDEYKNSFELKNEGKVTGTTEVKTR